MTAVHGAPPAARRAVERCRELARFTDDPPGITRTFLSPAARAAQGQVLAWMKQAGLAARVDAAGNLRGRRAGTGAGTLLIGSHADTVPNAGMFDGLLGVTLALELAGQVRSLPFALEVVAFSEEEGVRFGTPFIGSRALAGTLDPAWLDGLRGADGVTLRGALQEVGLNPGELPGAVLREGLLGFLELHIEQGPVLERLGAPVGIVSAVSGQSRAEVRFVGQAAHAGTTPMPGRRDALAAASAFVLACEGYARATPGLVATVGQLKVGPGAANVIPGLAALTLDLRHSGDRVRGVALAFLGAAARRCGAERGVDVTFRVAHEQAAVPLDPAWRAALARLALELDLFAPELPSGAGHDAMILAPHAPAALLFVRSPNGLSHHPGETVNLEDVEAALTLALAFVRDLAGKAR